MNKDQLAKLKEFLNNIGFEFSEMEQRITKFDNKNDKGEVVITYQARFGYEIKLKEDEEK